MFRFLVVGFAALFLLGAGTAFATEHDTLTKDVDIECDGAVVTIGFDDVVPDGDELKFVRVYVDEDGSIEFNDLVATVQVPDPSGSSSDDSNIWSEKVAFGSAVRAVLDNDDQTGEYIDIVDVDVPDGEETCDGTITIIKDTNPETNDPTFTFDTNYGDFSLEDDESDTATLDVGVYHVEEDEEPGWDLVDIDCNSGSDVDFDEDDFDEDFDENDEDEGVSINLRAGEDVTCVFVNEPEVVTPAPTPVVVFIPAPAPAPIIVERIVQVPAPAPVVITKIAPPSTGDGGIR